jgi:pectate lyase
MKQRSSRVIGTLLLLTNGIYCSLFACGTNDDNSPVTGNEPPSGLPQEPAPGNGGASASDPSVPPATGNAPGGIPGASGSGGSSSEMLPGDVPLAGSSGSGGADGSSGEGVAAGSGGAAGAPPLPQDCEVPPAASPLVGWAAVAGLGTTTTTGGGDATPIVVTTLGELQAAVEGTDPSVIHVRGNLEPGDIEFGSNKTIIGLCGAQIHGHLELSGSVNVIVRNVTIVGYGEGNCALDPDFDSAEGCSSGADAVSVQRNSHHIWFDHAAVRDGTDGNLDVSNGANFVTVSWTKFSYTPRTDDVGSDSTGASGHRYSNLVGGTDEPDDFDDANALNVTWHHNWWADNVVERQPRVRFGQNHLFNNYYNSATTNYCIRAGISSRLLLEANFFERVDDPHEFNSADDETTANITADASNVYLETTSDRATGGGGVAFTDPPYDYTVDDANGIPAAVASGAGPQ